jgi:phospholipid/cholesterol/gamma-HCH transport system permease protein
MLGTIVKAQQWFENSCSGAGYTLELLGRATLRMGLLRRKKQEVIQQLFLCAFGSLPVVFIIALFAGMIMALQTGIELQKYGQEETLGYIVAASICREMGPVFTAIALAGLVGSTYAAEIGTMKVSEEVDALEVMSIDPIYYLVMPRVLALALAAVILTIYADAIGILGGALVAKANFNVSLSVFLRNAEDILKLKDIYGGLLKALVFGTTIAAVACSQGLRTEHGAEGVGRATLRTVVLSFIFVLAFNYFLTWVLYRLVSW